ncbi:MAG: hypothetical protein CVU59_07090 [Deltaproteobacteria bacterium HGW-Deltaproteobacteria-17]|nr:MAG: hypothetical protein CVU59_07090 [Deltaproteobacteria bacterium HGW-Deltaproteobacteria-17]
MVRFTALSCWVLFFAGCTVSGSGTIPPKALKDPKLLYEFGQKRLKKDYAEDARGVFAKVRSLYPLSQYAVLSELKIAETHRKEGNFITAATAYRDFEKDHPFHEAVTSGMTTWWIGYCNYRLGPGDFFLFPPAQQRDLAHTKAAYMIFQMFMGRYPESPYLARVKKYYARTREMLVKHEFYAADFYQKKHKPKAVRNRMEFILTEYPDSPRVPEAALILVNAYLQLDETKKAVDLCRKIIVHYPKRPQAAEAAKLLAKAELKLKAKP